MEGEHRHTLNHIGQLLILVPYSLQVMELNLANTTFKEAVVSEVGFDQCKGTSGDWSS
jgi:hypothetical protein